MQVLVLSLAINAEGNIEIGLTQKRHECKRILPLYLCSEA